MLFANITTFEDRLSITHVPTGYIITECESISDGKHFIEMLERSGIDWNFSVVETALSFKVQALGIIEDLQEVANLKAAETIGALLM